LSMIHPAGWRKPNTEKGKFTGMFEEMSQKNQMIYLEIHNTKDGQKMFQCGTRYDWYVLQKVKSKKRTKVLDEKGEINEINMNEWEWLPNYKIIYIKSILGSNIFCPIIYNRTNYGCDKDYVSKEKTRIFKYPLVHSTNLSGVRYLYSKYKDKGHFGIPKIIFGQTGINNIIIDYKGKYGMTDNSMGIHITSLDEGKKIKKALETASFKDILKACMFGNFRIDWRLFTYFRKDFWKEFI